MSNVRINEPMYFGPLSGYDTEELDRKCLDQDKKTAKGFKWQSTKIPVQIGKEENDVCQVSDSMSKTPDDIPSWDEFTQTTTFHGVRYIFDKTPFKLRRYGSGFVLNYYFIFIILDK